VLKYGSRKRTCARSINCDVTNKNGADAEADKARAPTRIPIHTPPARLGRSWQREHANAYQPRDGDNFRVCLHHELFDWPLWRVNNHSADQQFAFSLLLGAIVASFEAGVCHT